MRVSTEIEAMGRHKVIHTYYTRRNGKVAATSSYYSHDGQLFVYSFDNEGHRLRTWRVKDGNLTLVWETDKGNLVGEYTR